MWKLLLLALAFLGIGSLARAGQGITYPPAKGNYLSVNDTMTVTAPQTFASSMTIKGALTVSGGSVTIAAAGLSASTLTIRGTGIFVSSFNARICDGCVLYVTSGSIAANTTVTLDQTSFNNASAIMFPICSELEVVNTAAVTVRVKTLSNLPNSFGVYNADAINAKAFLCVVAVKPN